RWTRARTGAWRCEVPSTAAPGPASAASCSGRIRDGPQPNRPSAGLIPAGMTSASGVARADGAWPAGASDILVQHLGRPVDVADRPGLRADVAGAGPDQPPGALLLQDVRGPAGRAGAGEHRGEHVRRHLGEVEHDG